MSATSGFVELYKMRMREFLREPAVLFWVFGFPILLAVGLGIAFREKPIDLVTVGVLRGEGAEVLTTALRAQPGFRVEEVDAEESLRRLRLGKVALVVVPGAELEYRYDATNPEGVLARSRVDDALQRAAGRTDPRTFRETLVTEPGSRYVDFLVPGLLGMNILSGAMYGIGFALVDMRSRRLLKRLAATPMRRSHFLLATMASRMTVVIVEVALMLGFGKVFFGMEFHGGVPAATALSLLAAASFSGMGLLVATRTRKIEVVSGLINLAMLPMFVVSGVFFSSERFPDAIQPIVRAMPLTALNDALRAVLLEGADLTSQLGRIAILLAWGGISFVIALRLFRWN
ncbi:MAG: ABC transporter permease [Planctomycetota bacterium]|nr:ABC transporter permease [Planctomycetota bacterium]